MTSSGREPGAQHVGPKGWLALVVSGVVVVGFVIWGIVGSGIAGGTEPTASTSQSVDVRASTSPDPTAVAGPQAVGVPAPTAAVAPDPVTTIDPEPVVRETLAPVPLDEAVDVSPDVRVELVSIESVIGVANIAGEIGGPALRVTVEATNGGGTTFETPAVIVNLYVGDGRLPADGIREPGSRAFPGSIAAGSSATGVFIFTVPEGARETVLVEVDMRVGEPVVLFEGAVR